MAYAPNDISPQLRKELEGTPELDQLEAENERYYEAQYPKPSVPEVTGLYDRLRMEWQRYHDNVRNERVVRFLQDNTPQSVSKNLKHGRRVRSRLGHNEIMRVVAMATRNAPMVKVMPAGKTEGDRKRASKQERFCNQLKRHVERTTGKPLWRTAADLQASDGLCAFLVYVTDEYDKIADELERRTDTDEYGNETEESDRDYIKRTEALLQRCGPPFGIRVVEGLCLFLVEDEKGVCKAIVWERKTREAVYEGLRERGKDPAEVMAREGIPPVGTRGRPEYSHPSNLEDVQGDYVDVIQYWDRCWYAYIVDGKCIDGEPVRHHLPGVPVFPIEGMTTGSPNLAERLQGITWGMAPLETALNDLLTLEIDNALTFGRPRVAIETPPEGNLLRDAQNQPRVLDFDQPGVVQLNPGQKIVDAYAGFKPQDTTHIQNMLLMLWQRSGLNPIAQGESPGADPAGYTVNSLQGAAQANYEVLLDNLASAWGRVCDFVRLMIRDTIRDTVYLAVPMSDGSKGGTEWLGLGPDDIDETPCDVKIDPLSDANRGQLVEMFAQMNKEGYVPRRLVQEAMPGGDDSEAWDNEIVLDSAEQQLFPLAIQQAMQNIRMAQAMQEQPGPGTSGLVDAQGNPIPSTLDQQTPGAPTVGAEQAAASQGGQAPGETRPGPTLLSSARMSAGTNRGYSPPAGTMTETQGNG